MPDEESQTTDETAPVEGAISNSSLDQDDIQDALEAVGENSDHFRSSFSNNLNVSTSEDGSVRISTTENFVESIELEEEIGVITINVDSEHEYLQENDEFTVEITYSNENGRTTSELRYYNDDPESLNCFTRSFERTIEEETEEVETADRLLELHDSLTITDEYAVVEAVSGPERKIIVNIDNRILDGGELQEFALMYDDGETTISRNFAFMTSESEVTLDLENVIEWINAHGGNIQIGFESDDGDSESQTADEMVDELVEEAENDRESTTFESNEEGVVEEEPRDSTREVDEGAELTSETEMIERDRNVYNVSNISDERRLRTMAQDIETRVDQLLSKRQRIVEKLERMQEGEE